MKLIGLSFVMAGLVLAGCQKRLVNNEEGDATAMAIATPVPTPDYAPPGVFFLLSPVRKETKDGVLRLVPGTEVKLQRNGKYQTPEGEMAMDPHILTNDRTAARAAQTADRNGQARALPRVVAAAPPAAPRAVSSAAASQPVAALNPPATTAKSPSDEKLRAMRFKLASLKSEEAKLQANVTFLWEKMSRMPNHLRTQSAPSSLSGSTSLADWDTLNAKLAAVRVEIQDLEAQLQPPPS
ncbi:MAG: hypothetical protein ACAI37_27575 [Chthoniobacter sp.]